MFVQKLKTTLLFSAVLASSLGLFFSCSGSGDLPPEPAEDSSWHNSAVFKPLFGDFEKVDALEVRDEKTLGELRGRGKYLVRSVGACGSCHGISPSEPDSPLAGGRLIEDRFGEVYAANITSHPEAGIGKWNIADIIRALRASISKDGRVLSPDAHLGYRWMSNRDAMAIAVFLRASKPVPQVVERRELSGLARRKWGLISQHREFEGYVPELKNSATPQYGRYLARSVGNCRTCHTPDPTSTDADQEFAGDERRKGGFFGAIVRLAKLAGPADSSAKQEKQVRRLLSKEGQQLYRANLDSELQSKQVEPQSEGGTSLDGGNNVPEPLSYPQVGLDIRGSSETGLKHWDVEDVVRYLDSGQSPDAEQRDAELCPWPYYKGMTLSDKRAIALFLKQL